MAAEYEDSSPRVHLWLCREVHALLCCNPHTSDPPLHGGLWHGVWHLLEHRSIGAENWDGYDMAPKPISGLSQDAARKALLSPGLIQPSVE